MPKMVSATKTGMPDVPDNWSETERWVWKQIVEGATANLIARDHDRNTDVSGLDPSKPEGWGEHRRLSEPFLRTILTHSDFTEVSSRGTRILGAFIDGSINLEFARLTHSFWLEQSRITGDVKCRNIRTGGELSFEGSFIGGEIEFFNAEVAGTLDLSDTTVGGTIVLASASIHGTLDLDNANISGILDVSGARIDGTAFLSNGAVFTAAVNFSSCHIKDINLSGAKCGAELDLTTVRIDSYINLRNATVTGNLSLNSSVVGGALFMSEAATFQGQVDLLSANIGGMLDMRRSTFVGEVIADSVRVRGEIHASDGATFKSNLTLSSAEIGSYLDISGATVHGAINLVNASVGSYVSLHKTTVKGGVSLNSCGIGGTLFFDGARVHKEVDLISARIGGVFDARGSTFKKDVVCEFMKVGGSALLGEKAKFGGELSLTGASVEGHLDMSGSTFNGRVAAEFVNVAGTTFQGVVRLDGARIGGDLNICEATVGDNMYALDTRIGKNILMFRSHFDGIVDFTAAEVVGGIYLGTAENASPKWGEGAAFVLRNTRAGALQDLAGAWPQAIEIDGFYYGRLGGSQGLGEDANMARRPVPQYLAWLRSDESGSSQPYEHLARLFRDAGAPDRANDILFAEREQRRRAALSRAMGEGDRLRAPTPARALIEAFGLWLLKTTIGYGLGNRYFRVLWWVAGLTLIGAVVLIMSDEGSLATQFSTALFASLDQLLPVLTLDEAHDVLVFGVPSASPPVPARALWVRYYFYLHEIIGWVLSSFVVAGLAGLTQRN